ncbi:nucleoid-associated protein [Nibribacter ruber]|uniref:Nucleoid-associated protein n=1 Tax=Nibribacter ruber TaxID=2698458 RepID=A0A6P1NX16_9BACT|nr:nucleoid-associated protein [Nibribacter ruber]QHL86355.1 nucleoid-associated protein [Nibribacter ruber]
MKFDTASLTSLAIHHVGNKGLEQKLTVSENPFAPGDGLTEKLEKFFLTKFATAHERFKFTHASSLKFNEVYSYCENIFADKETFHENSKNIARHLFESSSHPKIKPGELYVCHFINCEVDERVVEAVGIFKTEVKSGYFDVQRKNRDYTISYLEGIDSNKFDKGCIIFNTQPEDGFIVAIIDNQNRGEEAQYWRTNFLGLTQISNEFHQTSHFLNLTKEFISERLTEEFEVEKTDQIALLNKSAEYFTKHETFDKEEFETEVFGQQPELIESFRNFDGEYRQNYEVEIEDSFGISTQAVKKQSRVFKSVLKLDKNFHVYIHGNKDMIIKGEDADGRKFYKLYFDEEEVS